VTINLSYSKRLTEMLILWLPFYNNKIPEDVKEALLKISPLA
jgi:hypothetical protein